MSAPYEGDSTTVGTPGLKGTNGGNHTSTTILRGVTEDHGSYNKHSATQAAGGALALPLLEKAARDLVLDPDDRPVVIADYGSSQGKNS